MIPKLAIEKAIDGGWYLRGKEHDYPVQIESKAESLEFFPQGENAPAHFRVHYSEIALDPSFWQALGKALGWKETRDYGFENDWLSVSNRFFEVVMTGTEKDTHNFWNELLASSSKEYGN